MKKTFNLLFATFLIAVGIVSCNDEDGIQDIIPEAYHEMLYVKENGTQNVTLYNVGEEASYTFTVCKGGSDPSLTATAKVTVIDPATDAECQEQAAQENVQYRGIPAEAYTLSNTDLEFSGEETWKQVTVTVDPQKVQDAMDGVAENSGELPVVWMLPLEVTSETDSVSSERNRYIIEVDDILTPQIGFTKTSEQYFLVKEYEEEPTATIDFALNMEYEKWGEFTCEFEVDKDYEYEEGKTLLPENSYEFSSVTFNAQESVQSSLAVAINGSALETKEYVLPIRIKSVSPSVEISESNSVCVLNVNISPADPKKLDRTGWAASSEACCTKAESWSSIGNLFQPGYATNVWWCATSITADYFTDAAMGGHNNQNKLQIPHWIIVDLQKECYVTAVSLYGLQSNENSYITKGEFYLGSERSLFTDIEHPEVWTHIGSFSDFDDGSGPKEQKYYVSNISKGRYLMIYMTGTSHPDGNQVTLNEIDVYGVPAGE